MARHRSPGGQAPSPALDDALDGAVVRVRGTHRLPAPSSALRGRVVVAAVAAGAFAAAAAGQTLQAVSSTDSDSKVTPLASSHDATAAIGVGGDAAPMGAPAAAPELLPVARTSDASAEVQKLTESRQVTQARIEREAEAARKAAEEAARPKTVRPTAGALTSGFGGRWGTTHYGLDFRGNIGAPIVAAADGVVIEAGPASGFGLWVRIQLDDGTVHVYGHMNSYSVSVGERVKAGEQIAEVGNRGQSTGPHLHFEVWTAGGQKVDPAPWLRARGVNI